MTYDEARTNLHIGDIVEVKSTHKSTLTAIYEIIAMEDLGKTDVTHKTGNFYIKKSIRYRIKLVAGGYIDHSGYYGKTGKKYGPGFIRSARNASLRKVEDL